MKLLDRIRLGIKIASSEDLRHAPIFVHDIRDYHIVDRESFLIDAVRGKRALHFGFLDSPFLEEKAATTNMLHAKLRASAESVFGIDINAGDLQRYRALTSDVQNCIFDISMPGAKLTDVAASDYDVILFPEVLEHIPNPGTALQNLHLMCKRRGAELIITVPNAFNLNFFVNAAHSVEIVHPDHLFYFSPTTIRRLVEMSGFRVTSLNLYSPGGTRSFPGIAQWGIVCSCEARA